MTKCPPGMARAEEPVEPVKLILRPLYRLGRGDLPPFRQVIPRYWRVVWWLYLLVTERICHTWLRADPESC